MSPFGVLGAYEWKTPKTAAPRDAEDFLAEITALSAAPALDVETSVVVDAGPSAQDAAPGAGEAAEIEAAAALPVRQDARIETAPRPAASDQDAPQDDDGQKATFPQAAERGPQEEKGTTAALTSATAPAEPPPPKPTLLTRQPDPAAGDGLPPPNAQAEKPVPALAQPVRPARLPNIFIPGPAPDDPGPREADPDELSTPLTRYRQPSH
jgi:hypothetical protein